MVNLIIQHRVDGQYEWKDISVHPCPDKILQAYRREIAKQASELFDTGKFDFIRVIEEPAESGNK